MSISAAVFHQAPSFRTVSALAVFRHARGWSQNELSVASGVSRATISRVESDPDYVPRLAARLALASVLGLDAELIFRAEGDEQ